MDINEVNGCTDSSAINYNVLATVDDGSCDYAFTPQTKYELVTAIIAWKSNNVVAASF